MTEDAKIYTMPQKFLPQKIDRGKKKFRLVVVLIASIIILGIVSTLYFGLKNKKQAPSPPSLKEEAKSEVTAPPAEKSQESGEEPLQKLATIQDTNGVVVSEALLSLPKKDIQNIDSINIKGVLPNPNDENSIWLQFVTLSGIYSVEGDMPALSSPAVLTISYKTEELSQKEVSEDELKIGVWTIDQTSGKGEWKIVDTSETDKNLHSVSATLATLEKGPYSVVPSDVNTRKAASLQDQTLKQITSTKDTDSDGLTDKEEELYTTDPQNPDSDADTFKDGQEVANLYNPKEAKAKIATSDLISTYTNPNFKYSILYPKPWKVRSLDENTNKEIVFTSGTGEFVEVIVQENPLNLDLRDWYKAQSPESDGLKLEDTQLGTLPALKSKNGLTIYLKTLGKIYIFTYNAGVETEVNFKTTFDMMVKSLSF